MWKTFLPEQEEKYLTATKMSCAVLERKLHGRKISIKSGTDSRECF